MRICILQHEKLVAPGFIEEWIISRNHEMQVIRVDRGDEYPSLEDFEMLIILGGQAGAYEENKYPWIIQEKNWIQSVIDSGKFIFGICLGAQLLADVYGKNVRKAEYKEIGWWPISFRQTCNSHALLEGLPNEISFFQFHQDTFDLPDEAVLQASNEAFENQAFTIGEGILGIQFHPEIDEKYLQRILDKFGDTFERSCYIQDKEEINFKQTCIQSKRYLFQILDNFETLLEKNSN
ncbi:type 1 glutamine amidotransferase [Sporosarcina sp. PTS2304]|uniref:type 1 glutamine amidotransferase n=1 Tax=Sporosarcina sp. PTS2304 TaxID=2283194 RepID=UPI000E0CE7BF|nr:type 1 glutamine amidotransferase [Sporosarcina sp. PTS2304]AXH99820.1 type 1 glutamine amidotransferase [Sporosarcina sp. PTS2304]